MAGRTVRRSSLQVLVIDGESIERAGLCALLREKGITVDAVATLDEMPRWFADPDLILIDPTTTGGVREIARVRARFPRAEVIAFSHACTSVEESDVRRAGASLVLSKTLPLSSLVREFRARLRSRGAATDDAALSRREREVLGLVIEGLSTPAIARRLAVSPKTVETHRATIYRKLGVHSIAQLFRVAARAGMLAVA